MNGAYRRADGAVFSAVDLAQCAPVHPTELREWAWPIDLVEDWLLHASDQTTGEFAHFLGGPSSLTTPGDVTEHLGRSALALHRLIRALGNQA